MSGSACLALYRGGTLAFAPFAPLWLGGRARRGKEDPTRLGERVGRPGLARPAGPLLWLHGASVGEALSLLPLAAALATRGFALLLTTGTVTGARAVAERLPPRVVHQMAPLDLPGSIRRFLNHWRPGALVLAESELWPNTMSECASRKIPVVLVNARMSERSFERWKRMPRAAAAIFGRLSSCLAQSEEHAARFAKLGAREVAVTGNLKLDGAAPPADRQILAGLRGELRGRTVIVGASTHPGEEALLLAAHRAASLTSPGLLTILVLRDVARGPELLTLARQHGLRAALRSRGAIPDSEVEVFIADTIGEMGLWLRLANVAIIGKTFRTGGGQTPLEAARCHVPIVHGPDVFNFAEIFDALGRAGGAVSTDAESLGPVLQQLLTNPDERGRLVRGARRVLDVGRGATERTLQHLEPLLAQAQRAGAGVGA